MASAWNLLLIYPLTNTFIFFYKILGGVGGAIIGITFLSRLILWPVVVSSIKTMKIQKELMPELEKLKGQYKDDKRKLAEAQAKLYQEKGIHPASGCLTQIVQIVFIIALYNVLNLVLKADSGEVLGKINAVLYHPWLYLKEAINPNFLYFNMTKPDPYYLLPVLSGLSQFLYSKALNVQMQSAGSTAEKTVDKKDDLSYNMQQQMLYMMPVMTVFIGLKLPAGLVFYWFLSTVVSLLQHLLIERLSLKKA